MSTSDAVALRITHHAEFTPSFSPEGFDLPKAYFATAQSIRDSLIINWNATYDMYERSNVKQAYYLSMEFLQLSGAYGDALSKLGHKLEDVVSQEPDAALGNGGLGRLASCFLDSLATLNYPAWGYGLRYKYGLFKQLITKEGQEEIAENWLEIVRNDISYPVKFYGKVVTGSDGKRRWIGGEDIVAVASDVPIPGYKTKTTINLRLWSTKVPSADFDLSAFNSGEHTKAWDDSLEGKTLRLKQQYTLCSASLQDIITRFEKRSGENVLWKEFPEKVAVQMNDTHPTLCIPELMRILMDLKGISWKEAWDITQRTVAYTNHTVLPEALEKWSLELMQKLLPRHLNAMRILENVELPSSIIDLFMKPKEVSAIDTCEVLEVSNKDSVAAADEFVGKSKEKEVDQEPVQKGEQKEEADLQPAPVPQKMVRMANLCVVGGHLWPEKFQNKTNGVTPRRWIYYCNPELSKIITKWTRGDDWVLNTEKLSELRKFADNEDLQSEWRAAKRINKMKVVSFLQEKTGYRVSPDAMFDIQVKRIHEYKRQLLNILGIVYRYKKMKEMNAFERKEKFTPRVCIFGGKAFATYAQAKRIVKLITDVVFVPDYNVSVAELLIPASELSQHISNMKFSMNGCILIGTLDGANVEIREEVGEDNFFLFGAQAHEISGLRKERAEGKFVPDPLFEEVKEYVRSGVFGPYDYDELMGSLEGNEGFGRADYFLVGKDFPSYIECQEKVDEAYRDQKRWTRMSILNSAGSYKFSSDRTIHESLYAV
ncbi:Glycosyl transferase, family 35 [Cynara cardunculus var. scolymus]|uniref:Alpha-1,4 glucan phosphorylase n=1 Tax=Cynara cardunculus var. scolymus TaxID=59895 RepID=A0A103Y4X5_CYNCS|nr:Glycosyl transferase, family 35 [Cynara cardunculus var. scolymus]